MGGCLGRRAGLAALLAAIACTAPGGERPAADDAASAVGTPAARRDPSKAHVPLPALAGWLGTLVLHDAVGVWTVEAAKVFPAYGCPELIGLDDKGRCIVLWSYSGKWTPRQTVEDLEWLGALAVADLDPRVPGDEIYTGGKRGNFYQIAADEYLTFASRVVMRVPGEELHTAVAGELDPQHPGAELLCFTGRGELHLLTPSASPDGSFEHVRLHDLPGRVRQARLLLDDQGRAGTRIVGVARSGQVLDMQLHGTTLDARVIDAEPMGLGRIAQRPPRAGQPAVLYVTRDDGVILRLQEGADGWKREEIFAGPQGPRGVAAGRFGADPQVETLAVFGYGERVQLLSRAPGGDWKAETIFEDIDKGHWLATAELDGRNGTDELVSSGYSGRIVLLSRPPGYAQPQLATDPDGGHSASDEDGVLP